MSFNIAVDGPAGAGKSTIARQVAKRLSFIYVDTGAMYRAMALYFLQNGIDPGDEEGVCRACDGIDVALSYENGEQQVILNGKNVSGLIRTEEVGNTASVTSTYGKVRTKLVQLQRRLAEKENVIMDGRDIGTCVLPKAPLKIYLTASVRTRAQRRYDELTAKGISCNIEEICQDIEDRDNRDMNREISPLKQAEDAILLDSSHMTIEEVVETIMGYVKKKRAAVSRSGS